MKTGKYPRTALLILTLLISVGSVTAQVIKGVTVGEDGKEIPYVGIALRSMPDSTLIGGTYSDERGLFELSIKGDSPHGADLILVASAIGYSLTADRSRRPTSASEWCSQKRLRSWRRSCSPAVASPVAQAAMWLRSRMT